MCFPRCLLPAWRSFRVAAVLWFVWSARVFSAEPSAREHEAAVEADRREQRGDWDGAGYQWEQAAQAAENSGDYPRAIAHCQRAVGAWRHVPEAEGSERQAFSLGVMSKLYMNEGQLIRSREANLAVRNIVLTRLASTCGWRPDSGGPAPDQAPSSLLALWVRAQRDAANWLDAQGRTVEAVEMLGKAEAAVRHAANSDEGDLHFYWRKVISTRAQMLEFLGFKERSLEDYRTLEVTRGGSSAALEWPQRFNLAYFSSKYYGPEPQYLDAARVLFREIEATGRRSRDLRRVMAKMAFAYGQVGANVEDLQAVIEDARTAGVELEAIYAQRDLAVMKRGMGRRDGVEDGLRRSLIAVRRLGVKRSEPGLYEEYGSFLASDGRPVEALRMYREALRLTRDFGWDQHLPGLLADLADIQAQLGDFAGLSHTLAELDGLIAKHVLVPEREFRALCARARVLVLLGRSAEADATLAAARSLADRIGLNTYQRSPLQWAANLRPVVPPQVPATPANVAILDLQPAAVIAAAPSGEAAVARFRLSNPGAVSVTGDLNVAGHPARLGFSDNAGKIEVVLEPSADSSPAPVSLQVDSGEEIIVTLRSSIPDAADLQLTWQQHPAGVARAICHFRTASSLSDEEVGATVSDTSLAFENPFYAVHLYHPVQVAEGTRSFRVLPSRRCRVEVFDATSGSLIAVDADGDGNFTSQGDSIASDADSDGFPDLPVDSVTRRGEMEILIFPITGVPTPTTDTRVEIQARAAAGWTTVAHDTLKPPRRTGR